MQILNLNYSQIKIKNIQYDTVLLNTFTVTLTSTMQHVVSDP